MFQNNAWNRTLPNMVVFDDTFVNENVYSGLVVGSEQRQNLHELILGARAVTLNQRLQQLVERIEVHNRELRRIEGAIPGVPDGMSVDEFCALPARTDIDEVILKTEQSLAAAREQHAVRNAERFPLIRPLPGFDITEIDQLLREDLPALDTAAAARMHEHMATLGSSGETWIAEGMARVPASSPNCPFCVQNLHGSPVIVHYRAYFGEEYTELKRRIARSLAELERIHGGMASAAFERAVRIVVERRQFWERFGAVMPQIALDTAAVVRDWQAAREAIAAALRAKLAAPLEPASLSQATRDTIMKHESRRGAMAVLDEQLMQTNAMIDLIKEAAQEASATAISADLIQLRAMRERWTAAVGPLCYAYLHEKAAKVATEQQRNTAQVELEQHKGTVFPGYEAAVNIYLHRFYAGFRVQNVTSTNTRGGPTCSYSVLVNNTPVAIAGGAPGPSFRTVLSAGDRNTLALAFFFASLDQRFGLEQSVIVIDDPVSSLDEHRELTTVQEVRRLAERAGQVIVLSHNKPFLCRIWEGADRAARAALEVSRDGIGSTIRSWDVNQDSISEHDRRHATLRQYLDTNTGNNREVATALRPVLEAFVRVSYPEHVRPGATLGAFRNVSENRVGTEEQVLNAEDTQELSHLVEYANRFHHDTNPAYETIGINDAELRGFVERAIAFTRRPIPK